MARRAPPADRLAVEAVLGTTPLPEGTMLDALDAFVRLVSPDTEPEAWQDEQLLQVIGETAAAALMMNDLLAEGAGYADSLLTVAIRLGISEKTLQARLRRTRKAQNDAA